MPPGSIGLLTEGHPALLEGLLGAHGLDDVPHVEDPVPGSRKDRSVTLHRGDHGPGHLPDTQLGEGVPLAGRVGDPEISGHHLSTPQLLALGVLLLRLLGRHPHQLGQEVGDQDHAQQGHGEQEPEGDRRVGRVHHALDRRQGEGRVVASAESPGDGPWAQTEGESHEGHHECHGPGRGGRQPQESETVPPERLEESGARLDPHGIDEEDHAEVQDEVREPDPEPAGRHAGQQVAQDSEPHGPYADGGQGGTQGRHPEQGGHRAVRHGRPLPWSEIWPH